MQKARYQKYNQPGQLWDVTPSLQDYPDDGARSGGSSHRLYDCSPSGNGKKPDRLWNRQHFLKILLERKYPNADVLLKIMNLASYFYPLCHVCIMTSPVGGAGGEKDKLLIL